VEFKEQTACSLFRLFEQGEISAVEIIKNFREFQGQRDKDLKAFVKTSWKRAEKKARALDEKRKRGEDLPPLSAVPIAIKDNIARLRETMTCSSNFLKGFFPGYSATVVEKLEEAGALIIGRTNMDEMAMGSTTETSVYHPTRNPHNLGKTPGGSSGGSAAAVGGGIVPVALGSETGGSVRQPASFCGNYGLRPTYGRISRFGLAAYASSLDQIGLFARDPDDLWRVFGVLAGKDKKDSTTVSGKGLERKGEAFDPEEIRVAFPREYMELVEDGEVEKRTFEVVEKLEKAGIKVEEISLTDPKKALGVYSVIATAEASSNLARFDGLRFGKGIEGEKNWEELIKKNREVGFGQEVKNRILLGTLFLSSQYREKFYDRAVQVRKEITQELDQLFCNFDLILSPATPMPAFNLGSRIESSLEKIMSDIMAIPGSLAGLPAISLPMGLNSEGLPLGLQLMAPRWKEGRLIDFSQFIREITGYREELKYFSEGGSE